MRYLRKKAPISETIEGVVLGGISKVCMSLTRGFLQALSAICLLRFSES